MNSSGAVSDTASEGERMAKKTGQSSSLLHTGLIGVGINSTALTTKKNAAYLFIIYTHIFDRRKSYVSLQYFY